jgi:hypothetical protein
MIARCGYIGCDAEREIEVAMVPGRDWNTYGNPTRIQHVSLVLRDGWGVGPMGDIYCSAHIQLLDPAADERKAHSVECPICGARPGDPCHNAGQWTPTHRLRREKADGK